MLEVEVKLPVKDLKEVEDGLKKIGFLRSTWMKEEDQYYDTENECIRNNGQALRIRTTTDLDTGKKETLVTFKGKKLDQISMSRKELETFVEDGAILSGIFQELGFLPVPPRVSKMRMTLCRDQMHACLDEVEDLGAFLELEMVLPETENKEHALEMIREVLGTLGYSLADTTTTSYLSQLQHRTDE